MENKEIDNRYFDTETIMTGRLNFKQLNNLVKHTKNLNIHNINDFDYIIHLNNLIALFGDNGCFINRLNELILIPKTNLYFSLKNVETAFDLKCKIIAWCSRDCCKSMPYRQNWRNEKYQKEVRDKINEFLRVKFNENEWMLIYTYLGNGCHSDLCKQFVENDFDINIIKEYEKGKNKNG